jgi:drug/metabolite transporter (DMT)-like permease
VIAFLLAGTAGACFGAMTVAVRTGLRRAAEPDLAPLVQSALACAALAAVAGAAGQLGGFDWGAVWPFAAIGLGVPGLSQLVFVRAVRDAGPSRAAVLIGTAPLLAAAIAIAFLDEPLRAALIVATLLIVGGGVVLALEGGRPAEFKVVGLLLALTCAAVFGVRDNLVRLAARSHDVPPLAAATASLLGATVALLAVAVGLGRPPELRHRLTRTVRAFLPAACLLAVAYGALVEAFAHGKVTVVSPLNATQSLWAVVCSAVVLGRSEAIGWRLVVAAALVVAGSALIGVTR